MGHDLLEDTQSIDKALAYIIHRTARLLRYNLIQCFKAHGHDITPEQWFILFRLHERDGLSQAELADNELNDRPNITRMIDQLEKKTLVVRAANPDDRRSYRIFLTKTGRLLLDELFPLAIAERKRLFEGFSSEEILTFKSLLKRLELNTLSSTKNHSS